MSKKKKKTYEAVSIPEMLGTGSTYLYVIVMLLFFPVFYRENLFELIQDKKNFFLIASLLYLVCLCPALAGRLAECIRGKRRLQKKADVLLVCMLMAAVGLSVACSIDRAASLNGISYRTVAADVFLLCILTCLGVRAFGRFTGCVRRAWLLGSAFVYETIVSTAVFTARII